MSGLRLLDPVLRSPELESTRRAPIVIDTDGCAEIHSGDDFEVVDPGPAISRR
jgi:hypothetical protein